MSVRHDSFVLQPPKLNSPTLVRSESPGGLGGGSMLFACLSAFTPHLCVYIHFCPRCEHPPQITGTCLLNCAARPGLRCGYHTPVFPLITSYLIAQLPAPTLAAAPADAAAPSTAAATPSPPDPQPEPAALPASHDPTRPAANLRPLSRIGLLVHLGPPAAVAAASAQPVPGPQPPFARHPAPAFAGELYQHYCIMHRMLTVSRGGYVTSNQRFNLCCSAHSTSFLVTLSVHPSLPLCLSGCHSVTIITYFISPRFHFWWRAARVAFLSLVTFISVRPLLGCGATFFMAGMSRAICFSPSSPLRPCHGLVRLSRKNSLWI